ncbi:ankyrin repeat domain-containing protein [Pseudomonas brassicacearum]|uniref:ankyrin repeat domain-containing protein n=1 Tax=Pseudomonas brassicacearum TaxID=930166 RepID=UPI000F4706AB|nr:ankyrin repeat domain-containing protein [Pseudomonas brassicacearum]
MLPFKPVFSRCRTVCALTLVLLGGSTIAQAAPREDLTQKLDEAVMAYAYSKEGKDLNTVNTLLKKGAKPNIQVLWHAAYYKRPDLVDRLLEFPVDVNEAISENGETVLLSVLGNVDTPQASGDDLLILQSLLKAGANTNVIAQGGTKTPLIAAVNSEKSTQPELVKLLLQFGADAKLVTPQGFSPLMNGGASSLEVIKLLIAAGTDPYGVSKVGSTPLHFVCKRAYALNDQPDPQAAQRIALLHKAGTSVDALQPQQQPWPVGTPLLENAISHNPDCIKALLAAGANQDAPAFPAEYVAEEPSVKGQTVRQHVLESAKDVPQLYSDAIVKLFE